MPLLIKKINTKCFAFCVYFFISVYLLIHIFKNIWFEYFTLFLLSSIITVYIVNIFEMPPLIPQAWDFRGNVVQVGRPNFLIGYMFFGCALMVLIMLFFISREVCRAYTESDLNKNLLMAVNRLAYLRFTYIIWVFVIAYTFLKAAFNPLLPVVGIMIFISVISVIVILLLAHQVRCYVVGQSGYIASERLDIYQLIRIRFTLTVTVLVMMIIFFVFFIIKI